VSNDLSETESGTTRKAVQRIPTTINVAIKEKNAAEQTVWGNRKKRLKRENPFSAGRRRKGIVAGDAPLRASNRMAAQGCSQLPSQRK
jgi:hypothetical protein